VSGQKAWGMGQRAWGKGLKIQDSTFDLWSLLLVVGCWLSKGKAHGVENIRTNIVFYLLTLCAMRHALCQQSFDC
jgi:hypothetical protein